MKEWLPITKKEVEKRGWNELDVVLFSGDAYVDHPAFGAALVGRVIENEGFRVAIVPQPNWRDDLRDFKKMGKPRLFFGVTAGNMDSMVNHYTANKRLRSDDAFTPDGKAGYRPDYPTIVYTKILKNLFPDVPVIIGGIEASLRRTTHYDYWQNQVKPSILIDSQADMLIYGMAENTISELLSLLNKGVPFQNLDNLPQTCITSKEMPPAKKWQDIVLHAHEKCLKSNEVFMDNFIKIEQESNKMKPARLIQQYNEKYLVINPPNEVLSGEKLDKIYDLPFTRLPHPKYNKKGTIPAYEMIRHSINIHRGCFGGCSFCTISMHQGKFIGSRSQDSILREVEVIKNMPDFKGYISDLGGPSANMYCMQGKKKKICEKCKRASCIFPEICNNLNVNHGELIKLYRKVRNKEGIKKVFIGSGIRYDLLMQKGLADSPQTKEYFEELVRHHVSGRLKVAPEHTEDEILNLVRKPSFQYFEKFKKEFDEINKKSGLNQQLIPYFISSLPGSNAVSMAKLAVRTKKLGYRLEQIQDYTPTPMTLSNVIYYTGIDPYSKKTIFTARSQPEKRNQRILFFWYKPENRHAIIQELKRQNLQHFIKQLY